VEDQQIIDRIQNDAKLGRIRIPSIPDVALRVRHAITDRRRSNAHIAKIIQVEPTLTARIIQIANSPMYRGKSPVRDCLGAVTRLGLTVTRNFVTSFTLRQVYATQDPLLRKRISQIWRHSCNIAAVSYVLSSTEPSLQADRAMLAGLLHDIGVLPVLHYVAKLPGILGDDARVRTLVQRLRVQLGSFLLTMWKFYDEFIDAAKNAENWQRNADGALNYSDVVMVSHLITQPKDNQVIAPHSAPVYKKFSFAGLGPDAALELLDNARDEIETVQSMLT